MPSSENNSFPQYHIYHPELTKNLESKLPTFFFNFVTYNFSLFAADYKCTIETSGRRMIESHANWYRDTDSALLEMNDRHGSEGIDHFKKAGFLAYWLRRRIVIDTIQHIPNPTPTYMPGYISPLQENFLDYGNEIASFLLGFHYCARFEFNDKDETFKVHHLSDDYLMIIL